MTSSASMSPAHLSPSVEHLSPRGSLTMKDRQTLKREAYDALALPLDFISVRGVLALKDQVEGSYIK